MSGNSKSGRKTKSEEQNLVENINKHISKDEAILKLKDMIFTDNNFKALQLYFGYLYGKPMQRLEANIKPEEPLFYEIEMIDKEGESQILQSGYMPPTFNNTNK